MNIYDDLIERHNYQPIELRTVKDCIKINESLINCILFDIEADYQKAKALNSAIRTQADLIEKDIAPDNQNIPELKITFE